MRVDLHTHTTASDGTLTPTELIIKAKQLDISAISITDHDTVDGVQEAIAAGKSYGVEVISGVELSVNHEHGSLHLLGYGFDVNHSEFTKTVAKLRDSRSERNVKIIARLNELGYAISEDDVAAVAGDGTIGRGHIGYALVKSGLFPTIKSTFAELLNRGAKAYVDRFRLELRDAVMLIHSAGGVAVWAHPGVHREELPDMLNLLPGWVGFGLDGLESDYSQHTIAFRDQMRKLAEQLGIIFTGGSDFHGALKPSIKLCDGAEGNPIDERCYYNLKDRIQQRVEK